MRVQEAKEYLEGSEEFKKFKDENGDFYFVHAFVQLPQEEWKLGYYGKDKDRIVVFDVGEKIFKNPEEEVFKEGGIVKELKLEEVKIFKEQVEEIAKNYMKEKHSAEIPKQIIAILQHLEKQVWNLTVMTNAFNIINLRVDAITGEILQETKFNVLSTGEGGLGKAD